MKARAGRIALGMGGVEQEGKESKHEPLHNIIYKHKTDQSDCCAKQQYHTHTKPHPFLLWCSQKPTIIPYFRGCGQCMLNNSPSPPPSDSSMASHHPQSMMVERTWILPFSSSPSKQAHKKARGVRMPGSRHLSEQTALTWSISLVLNPSPAQSLQTSHNSSTSYSICRALLSPVLMSPPFLREALLFWAHVLWTDPGCPLLPTSPLDVLLPLWTSAESCDPVTLIRWLTGSWVNIYL